MVLAGVLSVASARQTLYRGGPIITMDGEHPIAEALLTDGERIVAVGDEQTVRAQARRRVHEVNLQGRAVVPGFVDAHGHFPGEGVFAVVEDLHAPPIGGVSSMGEMITVLQRRAAETRRGKWVVGMGYDDTLLAEGRHPNRDDLDRVSSTHPVAAIHISGHMMAANTMGLRMLGLSADSPDPPGGYLRRRAGSQELDGVLFETASEEAQKKLLPGIRDGLRMARRAGERYTAMGVTTAQSGLTPAKLYESIAMLARLRWLPMRMVVWPDVEVGLHMVDGLYRPPRVDPRWLTRGAIKVLADGSIQGYTAHLREPYFTNPTGEAAYRGEARMAPLELTAVVTRLHEAGLQVAVHGNGDAAIDSILDAFAEAQDRMPRPDARHIVLHAQMADVAQLRRMAALALTPSFFVLHIRHWGDRHRDVFLGPQRAERLNPVASAIALGLRPTLHADVPIVPLDPLELITVAVTRETRTGQVLGPDERITPLQALRAVTVDAAWQLHLDGDRGSLTPGKLADLVILSRSPLESMDGVFVEQTVVGGDVVYTR